MASSSLHYILAFLLFLPLFPAHHHHHHKRPRTLHFTLFQHETVNKTVYTIVEGIGKPGTNSFGSIYAFQDPLRKTADPSSRLMGIAEGTSVSSSMDGLRSLEIAKVTLNLERHKGSISVLGSTHTFKPTNHPVVGGTGDFMLVQGIATTIPVKYTPPAFIYKVEFHLFWPPYAT